MEMHRADLPGRTARGRASRPRISGLVGGVIRRRGRDLVALLARRFADPEGVVRALDAGELDRARRGLRLLPTTAATAYMHGRLAEDRAAAASGEDAKRLRHQAVRQYRRALTLGHGSEQQTLETLHRLGGALEQLHRYAAASEAYASAVLLDSAPAETWYRLARLDERRGDLDACRTHCRSGLARDPTAPALAHTMLARSPRHFGTRRQVAEFIVEELSAIHARATAPMSSPDRRASGTVGPLDRPVFVYWAQGADDAPALVRLCLERLHAVVPEGRLHVLDRTTVAAYVELPQQVWTLADTDRAHFSDVLRTALLAQHGGLWVDATCYPGPGFAERVEELMAHELFAFRYHPPSISSWLLAAQADTYLIRHLDAALQLFWTTRTTKLGYFMFHHVFEALYLAVPEYRRRWDTVPTMSSRPPHRLQQALREPLADHDLDQLIAAGFVHKLTWKVRPDLITPTTVAGALLARPVTE